uniref:Uncharacterized protein n=1 Tax=Rhizoctonia cerealis phyllomonavirus TaxID=3068671 RepID=A0AA51BTN4_9MONO|nr:MAG: hypothetical protein [Rhizoctonia cerealis phyllomonavirus]
MSAALPPDSSTPLFDERAPQLGPTHSGVSVEVAVSYDHLLDYPDESQPTAPSPHRGIEVPHTDPDPARIAAEVEDPDTGIGQAEPPSRASTRMSQIDSMVPGSSFPAGPPVFGGGDGSYRFGLTAPGEAQAEPMSPLSLLPSAAPPGSTFSTDRRAPGTLGTVQAELDVPVSDSQHIRALETRLSRLEALVDTLVTDNARLTSELARRATTTVTLVNEQTRQLEMRLSQQITAMGSRILASRAPTTQGFGSIVGSSLGEASGSTQATGVPQLMVPDTSAPSARRAMTRRGARPE